MSMSTQLIVGIDEAGRGPWAGPLAAAAVVLLRTSQLKGVRDSKQLSAQRRKEAVRLIVQSSDDLGLGWATPLEIDQLGLTAATRLAMQRAYAHVTARKAPVIIDGSINYLAEVPESRAIVKADRDVLAVSAASIVAKHFRDLYMQQMALRYPAYGFERHVGYGTAHHKQMITQHGICELHRRSFAPIRAFAPRQEGL